MSRPLALNWRYYGKRLKPRRYTSYLGVCQDQINTIEIDESWISTKILERLYELYGCSSRDLIAKDGPVSIEYTHPLCEYVDNFSAIAVINRIVLILLEM